MSTDNRHAPLIYKSIKHNSVPWINSNIKKLIKSRDYHKKRAKKYNSQVHWVKYKSERNKVNSEMKTDKTVYYQLGKGGKLSNIAEININGVIYNDRKQIAEHLNDYFVNIGPTLAAECECLSDYYSNT